jgi:hypothetical protein
MYISEPFIWRLTIMAGLGRVQKGCVSIQPLTHKSPFYALGSNVIKNRKTSHTLQFWNLDNCRFRFV